MGKLTVEGKATKEVMMDITTMTIRFQVLADSSAKASERAYQQCESFLKEVLKMGIRMEQIRFGTDEIEQIKDNDELEVIATREITIRMRYQMAMNNAIMELIHTNNYDVDVKTSFELEEYKSIQDELIKEAIQDSKEKATYIAEMMGQRISGIDKVDFIEGRYYGKMDWMKCAQCRGTIDKRNTWLSDHILAPTEKMSKEIEIVWIVE